MPQVPNFQDQQRLQRIATDKFTFNNVVNSVHAQSVVPAPSQTPSVTPTNTPTVTPTPTPTPTASPYLPGGPSRFFYSDRASTVSFDSVIDNSSYESYFMTLTSVKISDGVQRIDDRPYGYGAFQHQTNLSAVSLGNGLTSIGNCAFASCESLTGIAIPNSVIKIGQLAFNNCYSNRNTTLGNSVSTIGEQAFQGNQNLVTIIIPSSVVFIGRHTFTNCSQSTEAIYFQGDAPVIGGDGILGNLKLFPPGYVYYCPYAIGFSDPFGGIPAASYAGDECYQ